MRTRKLTVVLMGHVMLITRRPFTTSTSDHDGTALNIPANKKKIHKLVH
jgi:hypothetical protein